ncbi:hypothetical protein [Caldalkalibacillus mannanilyticus]|uniref:hypothetical protein n=1 Tax=Caldalkalibacillus mannanilyticus TaxID=1418 RepID=UPI000468C1A2|nr:hypothetical protein [Caldalkalibacillus mannanilyticus]
MSNRDQFEIVFMNLKNILKTYETEMKVMIDQADHYYLDTYKVNEKNKLPIFFASTQIKKNYVSYYLMPVYAYPELLEGISDKLKKRMQGKSCFNFKVVDEDLVEELKQLTIKGYQKYRKEQLV